MPVCCCTSKQTDDWRAVADSQSVRSEEQFGVDAVMAKQPLIQESLVLNAG